MLDPRNERVASVLEGMAIWGAFFRENIDIFATEYLGLRYLKWFQLALLAMMNQSQTSVWIASRGVGKTFITALFICIRCILYPGTKAVVASGKRSQAINVLEKIQLELMRDSPNLKKEIDLRKTKFSGQDAKVLFHNGSSIKVVTAADSARGNRANILTVDEFRMVNKDTIDTVLKKFLTSRRMPPYNELTQAEKDAEYAKEPNKQCYLSSAYFADHWSYTKTVDTFKLMLDDRKKDFVCGFPYELSIQEGLLFKEDIEGEMLESDFNEIKWSINCSVLLKPVEPVTRRGTTMWCYHGKAKCYAYANHEPRHMNKRRCSKCIKFINIQISKMGRYTLEEQGLAWNLELVQMVVIIMVVEDSMKP